MSYLHSFNILHQELNPRNILEDQNLYPKLTDISINDNFYNIQEFLKVNDVSKYFPPEYFIKNEYKKESEVYSFALIVYSIMNDTSNLEDTNLYEQTKSIYNNERPELSANIPTVFQELITRCWSNANESRPTFFEITEELEKKEEYRSGLNSYEIQEYENYIQIHKTFNNSIKTSKDKNESDSHDSNSNPSQSQSQHTTTEIGGSNDVNKNKVKKNSIKKDDRGEKEPLSSTR